MFKKVHSGSAPNTPMQKTTITPTQMTMDVTYSYKRLLTLPYTMDKSQQYNAEQKGKLQKNRILTPLILKAFET